MSAASINGITIGYDDAGAAENVLVLVHGHPFDRSMWRPQVEEILRKGWRAVAPDLRGYGESSVVPGKTTLDVFATDIATLLDQLKIQEIDESAGAHPYRIGAVDRRTISLGANIFR